MDARINTWMHVRINGGRLMDGWTDRQTDGWVNILQVGGLEDGCSEW